ncbi:coiled-coil domain-containing protein 89 [Aulostomus maculatus]
MENGSCVTSDLLFPNTTNPRENPEHFGEEEVSAVHVDRNEKSLEDRLSISAEDGAEAGMLRSRVKEQSSLICILKHRVDELLLRCETLQKLNTDLEGRVESCQREVDGETKRAGTLKERLLDLAGNHQTITAFMKEYKDQNAELKLENTLLQTENQSLFSKKLQDKEVAVQNLSEEIKDLREKYTNMEEEYREKLAEAQSKLRKQVTKHQTEEASLCEQVRDAQRRHEEAAQMCTGERRGDPAAQEKVWRGDESPGRSREQDFDAFREHSNNLLVRERELNKTLRHMTD